MIHLWHPRRSRFRFPGIILILTLLLTLMPAQLPTAQALGQMLWWSEDGNSTAIFGPNAGITIYTGRMVYTTACLRGIPDTFGFPWTDIYIVPAGSVGYGSKLKDVSGSPNTVQGTTSSGVFIDETIGYTGPGGKIGAGRYDVVYDECQDGYLDVEDAVFEGAIEVVIPPASVPDLPNLAAIKEKAEKAEKNWKKFHDKMKKWFDAATAADVGNKQSQFWYGMQNTGMLVDPRRATLAQMLNQVKHYKGIAADPPDPNFQEIAELRPRAAVDPLGDDPLHAAAAFLGSQSASEESIAEAFLHALERYQGADQANDGSWAMVQAMAIQDYANALANQLNRTSAALAGFRSALNADGRNWDGIAADLQAFRDRVAAQGFSPDEIREARNLGMTPEQIDQAQSDLLASDFAFTRAGLSADIAELLTNNDQMMDALMAYFNAMQPIVYQLQTDPYVTVFAPISNPGGPYTANEGGSIALNGSASVSPSPITTYQWDLDQDGEFDDATGPKPTVTLGKAFRGFIGLKVTNQDGHSTVAYAPVTVNDVNRPPHVESYTPTPLLQSLQVGSSTTFAVTATDPENDGLTTSWSLDGQPLADGPSYAWTPTPDQLGLHLLEAMVRDNSPLGGSSRVRWQVQVLLPDADGDGWHQNIDCRDDDPDVNPGRTEIPGNGKDDDCEPNTSDTPAVELTPPADQTAPEGTATTFALGSFTDEEDAGPYSVTIDWGDGSAPSSLTMVTPGTIPDQAHTYADNRQYQVTVRVADNAGGYNVVSFKVSVSNLPPTATFNAPGSVPVGEAITLSLTGATDPSPIDTAADFTYAFDCGLGSGYDAFGSASSVTCPASAAVTVRTVKGQVRDKDGATSEYQGTVQVGTPVSLQVTPPTDQAGDEGSEASFALGSFTDTTPVGSYAVEVDWGDGSNPAQVSMTAPGPIPAQSHRYAESGAYTVRVTVTEAGGESASASFKATIANLPPTATFNAPSAVAAGQPIALSLTGAADPSTADTAAGFTYAFDCGTGSGYGAFGPESTATCTAPSSGSLTVKGQVRDKDDATSEYTATVQITAGPRALFSPAGSGRNVAMAEFGGSIHSASSQYSASHTPQKMLTFATNDQYWATLRGETSGWAKVDLSGENPWVIDRIRIMPAPSSEGVKDFTIAVSSTTADDAAFTTVLSASVATNNNALQEFPLPEPVVARYIKYSVLNNRGATCCTGTTTLAVVSSQFGEATVAFRNLSTDPDDAITSYAWDFGDGSTSSEANPTHTYVLPGTYTVSLTATDAAGNSDTFSLAYRVLQPPVIDFQVLTTPVNEGSAVSFRDTFSDPDGGLLASRTWNWGDGSAPQNATSNVTSHAFPDNGEITVSLTVTDDQGQSTTVQKVITVINQPPTLSAGSNQTFLWGAPVKPINVSASDPGAGDRPTLQCLWDLGDGTTAGPGNCTDTAILTPTHVYANPGTYTRTLTVTDKDGASRSGKSTVTITPHRASPAYQGVRIASAGEAITLRAKLRDLETNLPVAGESLTFTVAGQSLTGTTDANGTASVTLGSLAAGDYPVRVDYAGSPHYISGAFDLDRLLVDVADDSLVTTASSLSATELRCADPTEVTLQVTGVPPTTRTVPLDVSLVIDVSGSMSGANITAAKDAARQFVRIIDRESDGTTDGLIRGSQVTVIPFEGSAWVGVPLTANATTLDQYISKLGPLGGTAIHAGIEVGQGELLAGRKPGNKPIMILLSDGASSRDLARKAAAAAKAAGTELFTIALGTGADTVLMESLASDPKADHYFFSPSPDQLEQIYRSIASAATGPAATNLVVTAKVDPGFAVDPASISPAPTSVLGNQITWSLAELKGETRTFTYRVTHQSGTGLRPIHQSATVQYTDSHGGSQSIPFPELTAHITCAPAITYQGDLAGQPGAIAHLAARLTDPQGQPLANRTLSFDLDGLTASAPTGDDGVATADLALSLAPGAYPLTVTFAGGDGYLAADATVAFTVTAAADGQAPITTITPTGTAGQNGWWTSDVTVTLSAIDQPSGAAHDVDLTEYSLDGGATWTAYNGPFTLTDEGSQVVMARSRDKAGNLEEPPVSTSIAIDRTPPVLSTADPVAGVAGSPVLLEASAADVTSGIDAVAWDLDGDGTFETAGASVSQIWPDPGTYSVRVKATDKAGHQSEARVTVSIAPGGICQAVIWKDPLSADTVATISLTEPLSIRFGYNGCTGFVRDESVVITIHDRATGQEVTTWVYDLDIVIDETAQEYRVEFQPGLYGLSPGQELVITVFIQGEPVGEATVQIAP